MAVQMVQTLQGQPGWLASLEAARQSGTRCFVLTFNTADLVYVPGHRVPPSQLKIFLGQHLREEWGYEVFLFSLAYGLQHLGGPDGNAHGSGILRQVANPRDPEQVLQASVAMLRRRDIKVALIVDYADHLAPASQGMNAVLAPQHLFALQVFHSLGTDDAVRASQNLVVLISHENQLNDLLVRGGSGYRVIQVDLPGEGDRRAFAELLLHLRSRGRRDLATLDEGFGIEEFSRITGGLRLRDIEEIFRFAASRGGSVTRQMVRDRKKVSIHQLAQGLLEVKEPEYGFKSVAGLKHAIDYFQRLKWRFERGASDIPQAILLAGVPGCGKSFLVLALAHELGIPCLVMRNIRERWVGASERNLELVLWIAQTLSPCLIWMDELDQALGQRTTGESADAGTSERMLARLWEFMGGVQHRGRILWVATTNRPDLLDAATLDRFQVVLPFIHPSPGEIRQLLEVLARQLGRKLEDLHQLSEIATLPNLHLPTVRGLQEIVAKAGELADWEAQQVGSPIGHRHLLEAARDYKPNYNPLLHEFIALTALRMTTFQSLLPWRGEGGRRPDYALPSYLEPLVTPAGELDMLKVCERLNQLQQLLQWESMARRV